MRSLLILLVLVACSSGGLDDRHDSYLAIFGIPRTAPAPQKGALLGRVLQSTAEPAAWAQIFARQIDGETSSAQPLESLANAKGGFLLPALQPGTWRVIATTVAGEGLVVDLDVANGELREEQFLKLTPLRHITGQVALENRAPASGVLVSVLGTPFAALTNSEGYFSLNVPDGEFHLRAEKDNFMAADFDGLSLTGDQDLVIELRDNPWPNGRLSVKDAENGGHLVRTLNPTIAIEPVAGVKYMHLISTPDLMSTVDASKLREWLPIKEELTLPLSRPGYVSSTFEFRDNYGKVSAPVTISFFATDLDPSWIVLFGRVTQPLTIKSGQKVMFMGGVALHLISEGVSSVRVSSIDRSTDFVSDDQVNSTSMSTEKPQPATSQPANEPGDWFTPTTFEAALTVEPGAILRGGATFVGPLSVRGTSTQPVVWEGACRFDSCSVNLYAEQIVLQYVQATDLRFQMRRLVGTQTVVAENAAFIGSAIVQNADFAFSGERSRSDLTIAHSTFKESSVALECERLGGAATSGQPVGPQSLAVPPPNFHGPLITTNLSLASSTFDQSLIRLGCARSVEHGIESVRIALSGNSFLSAPEPNRPIFRGYREADVEHLPPVDLVDYAPQPNWFADPNTAVIGVTSATWPLAIFGNLLPAAPSGAGVQ